MPAALVRPHEIWLGFGLGLLATGCGPSGGSSPASASTRAEEACGITDPCHPWLKNPEPVWAGYFMAADPSVIRDDDVYRMYFTGFLLEPDRATIGMAISTDGVAWDWATPTTENMPVSVALDGRPGRWDENIETVHVMKVHGEFWMFYTGYGVTPDRFVSPYEVGLAKSNDGLTWARASEEPVLELAPAGPGSAAMTSPAVVEWNDTFYMIFLGWDLDAEGNFADFQIRGAMSTDRDGLEWQRHHEPVLEVPIEGAPWVNAAVEPTLMQASDGLFYLFITADDAASKTSPSSIAVLKSTHPFGPWDACPDPIVQMTQPWESEEIIAPHVMEDNGRLRMWYHGLTRDDPITGERFRIGYAEAPFERPTRFDVNEDRRVNSLDVEAGLQSPADWSNSGDVDFFDALRLLEAVDRGCP